MVFEYVSVHVNGVSMANREPSKDGEFFREDTSGYMGHGFNSKLINYQRGSKISRYWDIMGNQIYNSKISI